MKIFDILHVRWQFTRRIKRESDRDGNGNNWLRFLEELVYVLLVTVCSWQHCGKVIAVAHARENLARSIHNSLGFLPGAAFRMVELYLDIVSMRLMHYLPSCPTIYNKQEYFTREWRATEETDEIPWKLLVEPMYLQTIDVHRCYKETYSNA